ncbi:cell adhesion molecule 2 isoform X1 [Hyalella azteca]|uniref:Cell adhesion molecule 2 isoform X1 n=1 Tax=Hyalella azteca TaxID=294128 RepID=A0A979FYF5_HYAAZ|nr:cell adhesion molecule 2 isoform X1 [Hyalella azteca]
MASRKLLLSLVCLVCCVSVIAEPQSPLQAPNAASPPVVSDYSVGTQSQPVSIIFDNKQTIVNPGESLNLDCGVSGDFRYCHWETGKQNAIQVQDVYDGYIEGLSKPQITKGNECGIVIDAVTIEDHGPWTCKVFVIGHTLQNSKNVTVTIKPTSPILEVARRPLIVTEGDTETISCSVAAARPRVQIHWFLGDEDITYSSRVENSLTDNMGTYKSISTLTHMFKAWHNKKPLHCIVSHYTLLSPIEDFVDVQVKYKPWGKDVRLYDIRLGDDVEAKVNFSSNPPPSDIKWGYAPSYEQVAAVLPVPGEEGRYSTEMLTLEDGSYSVILRVLGFDEMDARMSFHIKVANDIGARDFTINLSTDEAPNDQLADGYDNVATSDQIQSQEPLSSGTLAAIVVVVLLVILVLLCAVYMKYNHLYCFAEKKSAKEDREANGASDTESAQAPGFVDRNKLQATSLFGKLQNGLKKSKPDVATNGTNGTTVVPAAGVPAATEGQNGKSNDEVVYAELDLAPGDKKVPAADAPRVDPSTEGTEYAHIVGVLDNQQAKK